MQRAPCQTKQHRRVKIIVLCLSKCVVTGVTKVSMLWKAVDGELEFT